MQYLETGGYPIKSLTMGLLNVFKFRVYTLIHCLHSSNAIELEENHGTYNNTQYVSKYRVTYKISFYDIMHHIKFTNKILPIYKHDR